VQQQKLTPVTPHAPCAFLVEEFNRIVISRLRFDPGRHQFERGLSVFEEKDDLLPFEEAKLYGHNATHALAAYLGAVLGLSRMTDLRAVPGVMGFLRAAFLSESGETLIRKHCGVDPLFTAEGYHRFATDLLDRMTNPYLLDTVARVGRDAARKLGWNDRLVGTIRLALQNGIAPHRYAFGAAAALEKVQPAIADSNLPIASTLGAIWEPESGPSGEREAVIRLIETACDRLRLWRRQGFQPPLEQLFA
jgi:mannitol-1-phosphate/altronate dehydrogenase